MASPSSNISTRLGDHSDYFSGLMATMPARYLTPGTSLGGGAWKYQVNKKEKAPKQTIKENTKKGKKLRLDPMKRTALDKEEDEQKEQENNNAELNDEDDEHSDEVDDDDDDVADDKEILEDDDDDDEHEKEEPQAKEAGKVEFYPRGKANTIAALRQRLQERIEERRGNRKVLTEEGDKLEFQAKKRKIEEKKAAAKKKKSVSIRQGTDEKVRLNLDNKTNATTTSGGSVVFSKFDFATAENNGKKKKNNADLNQLLSKAEKQKEKMEQLEVDDAEKAAELKGKQRKAKALEMAQGIKQTDDIKLIKKSLKRKEKMKQKSATAWSGRKKTVASDLAKRIERRESNLQKRIDGKKDKRMGKGKKKQKGRAGFEGKK